MSKCIKYKMVIDKAHPDFVFVYITEQTEREAKFGKDGAEFFRSTTMPNVTLFSGTHPMYYDNSSGFYLRGSRLIDDNKPLYMPKSKFAIFSTVVNEYNQYFYEREIQDAISKKNREDEERRRASGNYEDVSIFSHWTENCTSTPALSGLLKSLPDYSGRCTKRPSDGDWFAALMDDSDGIYDPCMKIKYKWVLEDKKQKGWFKAINKDARANPMSLQHQKYYAKYGDYSFFSSRSAARAFKTSRDKVVKVEVKAVITVKPIKET